MIFTIRRRPDRIHLDTHLVHPQLTPVEYERLFKDILVQKTSLDLSYLSSSLTVGRQTAETDTGASNVQPKCIFKPIFCTFGDFSFLTTFCTFSRL